jgi:hypothetical protein
MQCGYNLLCEDNNYCVGAYIGDNNGCFVQAFAKKLESTPSIVEAEAMRILEIMVWFILKLIAYKWCSNLIVKEGYLNSIP